MKICKKCKINRGINDFPIRITNPEKGKYDICKECKKSYDKSRRKLKGEELREYDRLRSKTQERRLQRNIRYRVKLKMDPEWNRKQKARRTLSNAIRDKKIIKPDRCSICGIQLVSRYIQGHHEDYDKPLDVIWCCQKCHWKLENEI